MQREPRKYLFDILQACGFLARFSSGKSLEDYQQDPLLRSAVERQFEIVGEALNQAIKAAPELAAQVARSGRIIAFRNRLIHAYSTIADEVVWDVLKNYVPDLEQTVRELLKD